MDQLRRVRICGFKSIREADLALVPLNVCIGTNGSGKSNFISFFRMLSDMMAERLQEYVGTRGGANAMLHYGAKVTARLSIRVEFESQSGINTYEMEMTHAAGDKLIFTGETVSFSRRGLDPATAPRTNLGVGQLESGLIAKSNEAGTGPAVRTAKFARHAMQDWRVFQFHDTSASSPMKQMHAVDDCRYLRDEGSNLGPFLLMLQTNHNACYRKIVATIARVFPCFGDFVLAPSTYNDKMMRLAWRERGADLLFDSAQLSDGTLRFIALATLLLQPDELMPTMLIIDEPELGLHPSAIALLASLVRMAAEKRQVVLATQSRRLVDEFTPEDVVVLDRHESEGERFETTFRRLNSDGLASWLEDYTLGEIWEKNLVGGRP